MWAETRNLLIELVEKKYDYYALVDYDYILRPQRKFKCFGTNYRGS
jgi:hypothetical protein